MPPVRWPYAIRDGYRGHALTASFANSFCLAVISSAPQPLSSLSALVRTNWDFEYSAAFAAKPLFPMSALIRVLTRAK